MSLLPSATFAGPSQAEALWAVAGSTGPGGGVTQLVAGANITLDPPTGEGVVTINATGGGGGGVTEILSGGAGLGVSNPTGAVTLTNTGVTEIIAGTGISISGTTGAVTVTNTFASGVPTLTYVSSAPTNGLITTPVAADVIKLTMPNLSDTTAGCFIWREGWSVNDVFTASLIEPPGLPGVDAVRGTLQCDAETAGGLGRLAVFYYANSSLTGAVRQPYCWIIRYAGNPI